MSDDTNRDGGRPEVATEDGASGGRYVVRVDGAEAEMTYSRLSPKTIIVDHTSVPEALRGRKIGEMLAEHAVAAARQGGWQIIPLCPFMRAQAKRHPEWADAIRER